MAKTKEVKTLLGEPEKAVRALAIPTIIAMVINSLYGLIDAAWVAGLGYTALAAVGVVNPIYLMILGFSNGLSAGATSVISRYIGAKNKKEADNAALHVLILIAVFSICFIVILNIILRPLLLAIGAGDSIGLSIDYGSILISGSFLVVFSSTAYGIFRAEGNAKKATYAMLLGSITNIILDPIFIYVFDWGIRGAAFATVVSLAIVSILIVYWLIKDTYINFSPKDFVYKNKLFSQILSIGLPTGLEFLLLGVVSASLNVILLSVSGLDSVAVYSGGWRVVSLMFIPSIAIGTGLVAVVGVNFGAEKFENVRIAHAYSVKMALMISLILSIVVYVFAPQISQIFSMNAASVNIISSITNFLRITSVIYLFSAIGVTSAFLFRGVGKGLNALIITILRSLIFQIVFSYIFAVILGFGANGVWYGIVLGIATGNTIAYIWGQLYLKKLIKNN